jgi:hypothetical protein
MGLEDAFDALGYGSTALPEIEGTSIDWVSGAGHSMDPFWQAQEVDGWCAPTSAAIAIGALLGDPLDKDGVVQTAISLGLLEQNPDGTFSGMTCQDLEQLIDHYGLDADMANGSMSGLRDLLNGGSQIIVSVDADEVWYQQSDDLAVDDAGADHALVVAGIDDSRGMVILADPGDADRGRGYEIPIAMFEDAWADSDHEMVVAQNPSQPTPMVDPAAPASPISPAGLEPGGEAPAPVSRPIPGSAAEPASPIAPDAGRVREDEGDGGLGVAAAAPLVIVPLVLVGHAIRRVRIRNRPGRA